MKGAALAAFAELARWPIAVDDSVAPGSLDRVFQNHFGRARQKPKVHPDPLLRKHLARSNVEVAGMSDAAVLASFESLGDNCEFGIVQQKLGVDAPGLLTFARTPPDMLAEILMSRLDGVGDPDALRLATRLVEGGIEHILFNDRLGIVYHVVGHPASDNPREFLRLESERLQTLAGVLIEKLTAASHIFVVKCNEDLTVDEARQILEQIEAYGPNCLLYVVGASSRDDEGSVVKVAQNLYRGHISGFAPYHSAYSTSVESWTKVCRNMLSLRRAEILAVSELAVVKELVAAH